jgi:hypothetical protein
MAMQSVAATFRYSTLSVQGLPANIRLDIKALEGTSIEAQLMGATTLRIKIFSIVTLSITKRSATKSITTLSITALGSKFQT